MIFLIQYNRANGRIVKFEKFRMPTVKRQLTSDLK